jgi:hypothetical protein
MKTLIPLFMAVMAFPSLFGQGPTRADTPGNSHPLDHSDSLVLIEAGAEKPPTRVLPFPLAIDAILRDFPNKLRNITGELVLAEGEFENYASTVVLPGAENCIITRYHSTKDSTVSWQARMFNNDEFTKASREYHALYMQLQTCYIMSEDGTLVYLTGAWEPAKDGASFTTSTLRLATSDRQYKDVKVEIELVYLLADWAVNINIIARKPDDEAGGGSVGALMQ